MLVCAEFVHLCVGGVGLTGCRVLQGSEQGHKLLERTRSLRPSAFSAKIPLSPPTLQFTVIGGLHESFFAIRF